jgi:hypothetical protein
MQSAERRIGERMRAKAQEPNVDVLEYVYDTQARGADATTAVKLATLVAERRRELGPACPVAEARRRLCEADPNVRDFATSFPQIFALALDYEGAPRHLAMMKQQARLRQEVESGSMTEAEANVHATRLILEKTAREPSKDEAGRPSTAPAHLDISPPAPSTA